MGILLAILLGSFLSGGLIDSIAAKRELKLLHVLFRHGDITPRNEIHGYPTDPLRYYSFFPFEDGDLSHNGRNRTYEFGQKLRQRYGGQRADGNASFLGTVYSKTLVHAQSTEVPSTQMSLEVVLQGLFPPEGEQIWDPMILSQPVYTQYIAKEKDGVLFSKNCRVYLDELNRVLKLDEFKRKVESYNETMAFLTNNTNKKIDNVMAVANLYHLFTAQISYVLPVPEWIWHSYPFPMRWILDLYYDLLSYTPLLKRMNAGPLLRNITEDMKALKNETLKPAGRKAFLYAAHDVNIAGMVRALGIEEPLIPEYSSAIVFETRQDATGQYFVQVLIWRGLANSTMLQVQKIPGCRHSGCRLEKFLKLYNDIIPPEEEFNCYSQPNYKELNDDDDEHTKAPRQVYARKGRNIPKKTSSIKREIHS